MRSGLRRRVGAPHRCRSFRRTVVLSPSERQFLSFALDLAFDQMVSKGGFTDEDEAALKVLRSMAEGKPRQWCKCRDCWGWFVEDHPGEDLDELGRDLSWWSGLPEHRDAPLHHVVTETESGCAHCGGAHSWDDCEAYAALVSAEEQPAETQDGFELRGTAEIEASALDDAATALEAQSCTCGCRRGAEFLRQRSAVIRAAAARPAVGEQPETQETDRD